ncbi:uncharacterized protein LOC130817385 [Amaranthus tricolor]|uniref:uncharacterized protein LOC130817385 n=1 Tax=Amaranthus tricolor TaxID=29722 RepID=UPI00258BA811|nr:uncharacterized protein LOC130817385 [Amaranthus tricolor]
MAALSRNFPSPTSLITIIIISSLISLINSNPNPPSNPINSSSSPDIHDILPYYNLPKGVIPNGVKCYTLSSINGSFTLEMEHPCYVKFPDNQIVYYDKIIKGKLSYGKVSDVKGIQAKKFFVWVSVTGMEMDPDSGMVEFFVGALSQKLPAKMFEVIPTCMNKAYSVLIGYVLNLI